MKSKAKRLLSLLLAIAMILTTVGPVFADFEEVVSEEPVIEEVIDGIEDGEEETPELPEELGDDVEEETPVLPEEPGDDVEEETPVLPEEPGDDVEEEIDEKSMKLGAVPALGASCKHKSKTKVDEVSATCTKQGVKEHYVCENCGALFTKKLLVYYETTKDDLLIEQLDHDYQIDDAENVTCSRCDFTDTDTWGSWHIEITYGLLDVIHAVPIYNHIRSSAKYGFKQSHTVLDDGVNYVKKKDATCKEAGNIEYYTCKGGCDLKFKDVLLTTLVDGDVSIPRTDHDYKWTEKTIDSLKYHVHACAGCGDVEKEHLSPLVVVSPDYETPKGYEEGTIVIPEVIGGKVDDYASAVASKLAVSYIDGETKYVENPTITVSGLSLKYGEKQTATATSSCIGTDGCALDISSSVKVYITSLPRYTVKVSHSGNGSIKINDKSVTTTELTSYCTDSTTVTIKASDKNYISAITQNSVPVTVTNLTSQTITLSDVTAGSTVAIDAQFKAASISLTNDKVDLQDNWAGIDKTLEAQLLELIKPTTAPEESAVTIKYSTNGRDYKVLDGDFPKTVGAKVYVSLSFDCNGTISKIATVTIVDHRTVPTLQFKELRSYNLNSFTQENLSQLTILESVLPELIAVPESTDITNLLIGEVTSGTLEHVSVQYCVLGDAVDASVCQDLDDIWCNIGAEYKGGYLELAAELYLRRQIKTLSDIEKLKTYSFGEQEAGSHQYLKIAFSGNETYQPKVFFTDVTLSDGRIVVVDRKGESVDFAYNYNTFAEVAKEAICKAALTFAVEDENAINAIISDIDVTYNGKAISADSFKNHPSTAEISFAYAGSAEYLPLSENLTVTLNLSDSRTTINLTPRTSQTYTHNSTLVKADLIATAITETVPADVTLKVEYKNNSSQWTEFSWDVDGKCANPFGDEKDVTVKFSYAGDSKYQPATTGQDGFVVTFKDGRTVVVSKKADSVDYKFNYYNNKISKADIIATALNVDTSVQLSDIIVKYHRGYDDDVIIDTNDFINPFNGKTEVKLNFSYAGTSTFKNANIDVTLKLADSRKVPTLVLLSGANYDYNEFTKDQLTPASVLDTVLPASVSSPGENDITSAVINNLRNNKSMDGITMQYFVLGSAVNASKLQGIDAVWVNIGSKFNGRLSDYLLPLIGTGEISSPQDLEKLKTYEFGEIGEGAHEYLKVVFAGNATYQPAVFFTDVTLNDAREVPVSALTSPTTCNYGQYIKKSDVLNAAASINSKLTANDITVKYGQTVLTEETASTILTNKTSGEFSFYFKGTKDYKTADFKVTLSLNDTRAVVSPVLNKDPKYTCFTNSTGAILYNGSITKESIYNAVISSLQSNGVDITDISLNDIQIEFETESLLFLDLTKEWKPWDYGRSGDIGEQLTHRQFCGIGVNHPLRTAGEKIKVSFAGNSKYQGFTTDVINLAVETTQGMPSTVVIKNITGTTFKYYKGMTFPNKYYAEDNEESIYEALFNYLVDAENSDPSQYMTLDNFTFKYRSNLTEFNDFNYAAAEIGEHEFGSQTKEIIQITFNGHISKATEDKQKKNEAEEVFSQELDVNPVGDGAKDEIDYQPKTLTVEITVLDPRFNSTITFKPDGKRNLNFNEYTKSEITDLKVLEAILPEEDLDDPEDTDITNYVRTELKAETLTDIHVKYYIFDDPAYKDVASAWIDIDKTFDITDTAAVRAMINDLIKAGKLIQGATQLPATHAFGAKGIDKETGLITDASVELIKLIFDGNENWKGNAFESDVTLTDLRIATVITYNYPINIKFDIKDLHVDHKVDVVVYSTDEYALTNHMLPNVVVSAVDPTEVPDDTPAPTLENKLSIDPKMLNVKLLQEQNVVVYYAGDYYYKPTNNKDNPVKVYVLPHEASLELKEETFTYDDNPHSLNVITDPKFLDRLTLIAGVDGNIQGFVSLNLPNSVKNSMKVKVSDVLKAAKDIDLSKISGDKTYQQILEWLEKNKWVDEDKINDLKEKLIDAYISSIEGTDKDFVVFDGYKVLTDILEKYNELGDIPTIIQKFYEAMNAKMGDGNLDFDISDETYAQFLKFNMESFAKIYELAKKVPEINFSTKIYLDKDPINAGLYWEGAVSTDINYVICADSDYLLIKQKTEGVDLKWNSEIANKQLKYQPAQSFDFGASIWNDGKPLAAKDDTEHIHTAYFKVPAEADGSIDVQSFEVARNQILDYVKSLDLSEIAKIKDVNEAKAELDKLLKGAKDLSSNWISSSEITNPGTYIEVAFIFGGNYFSEPIARVYTINYVDAVKIDSFRAENANILPIEGKENAYYIIYDEKDHKLLVDVTLDSKEAALDKDGKTIELDKDKISIKYDYMVGDIAIPDWTELVGYPENIGTYRLTASYKGDAIYKDKTEVFTLTILPKPVYLKFTNEIKDNTLTWTEANRSYAEPGKPFDFSYQISYDNENFYDPTSEEISKIMLHDFFGGAKANITIAADSDPITLPGAYVQTVFALNPNYKVEPIWRPYTVLPQEIEITTAFDDTYGTISSGYKYDTKPHGITYKVTAEDGTDLTNSKLTTIVYSGVDNVYLSSEAPSEAGTYRATVTYNGEFDALRGTKSKVVKFTIDPVIVSLKWKQSLPTSNILTWSQANGNEAKGITAFDFGYIYKADGKEYTPGEDNYDGFRHLHLTFDGETAGLEHYNSGTAAKDPGVYTQTLISDSRNYVTEPLVRIYTVLPQTVVITTAFDESYDETAKAYMYDGHPHGISYTVTSEDNKTLTDSILTTILYSGVDNLYHSDEAPTNVGTYLATVAYHGELDALRETKVETVKFTIKPVAPTVVLQDKPTQYTGKPQYIDSPTITFVNNEKHIVHVEYTYAIDEQFTKVMNGLPVNAGTYYVKASIEGFGNYTYAYSNVAKLVIDKVTPEITVKDLTVVFDGTIHRNPVEIKLVNNEHYALSGDGAVEHEYRYYTDPSCEDQYKLAEAPTSAGTYYVKLWVDETTNYTEATSSNYGVLTITEASLENFEIVLGESEKTSYMYDGQEHAPAFTVVDKVNKELVLTEGVDYTISISPADKKNAAEYTVSVTGIGNYQGTLTLKYTILPSVTITDVIGYTKSEGTNIDQFAADNVAGAITISDAQKSEWDLKPGTYKITIEFGSKTMTDKLVVANDGSISIPSNDVHQNVYLTVDGKAIATGFNDSAKALISENNIDVNANIVELNLNVQAATPADATKNKFTVISQNTVAKYYEMTVSMDAKALGSSESNPGYPKTISDTKSLLEIIIPLEVEVPQGKMLTVERLHGEAPNQKLTSFYQISDKAQAKDGTFMVSGKQLVIFAEYFSTYRVSYKNIPSSSVTMYDVILQPTVLNGKLTANHTKVGKQTTVVLTVTPEKGYELNSIKVVSFEGEFIELTDLGNGQYSFKMPTSDVEVFVSFESLVECKEDKNCVIEPFRDTENSDWWHDGIHYSIENEIMNGMSKHKFQPQGTTTRAQIVTMLWRLEGSPVVNYAMKFTDLKDDWYKEAVRWAASTGVVDGYNQFTFGPSDPITREQFAAIMYRYANMKSLGFGPKAYTSFTLPFKDVTSVSKWAKESLNWCYVMGLITGKPGQIVDPQGFATRAEAATMMYRFCGAVKTK